jgi:hypothetical protein
MIALVWLLPRFSGITGVSFMGTSSELVDRH